MNENQNFATRFPFGYGLTYTTFGIGKLLTMRKRDGTGWTATVEIRNVGDRAGTETLQVYIQHPEKPMEKRSLKAFKQVFLLPEQKKTVAIHIPYSAFEYLDADTQKWVIDPGMYNIMIGTSAEDIKLQKIIEIKNEHINHEKP
jgi:beta-glucosidase